MHLLASVDHHEASSLGVGGIWFPAEHLVQREGFENIPVTWKIECPQYIINRLVTLNNPTGTIFNWDLELAG